MNERLTLLVQGLFETPVYNTILTVILAQWIFIIIQVVWIITQMINHRHEENLLEKCNTTLREDLLDLSATGPEGVEAVVSKAKGFHAETLANLILPYITVSSGRLLERLNEVYSKLGLHQRDTRSIRSPFWHRRLIGIRRLALTSGTGTGRDIMRLIKDRYITRVFAANVLSSEGDVDGLIVFMNTFNMNRKVMEQPVSHILSRMTPELIGRLADRFGEIQNPSIKRMLLLRYVQCMPYDAIKRLHSFAMDESKEVRIGVCLAASGYSAADVSNLLRELAADPSWEVRAQAAKALGVIKDSGALPMLSKALGDPSFWVRQNSAAAMSGMGGEGLAELRRIADEVKDRFASDTARQELRRFEVFLSEGGKLQ